MSKKQNKTVENNSFLEKMSGKYLYFFLILTLFVSLMIFYKPMAIDGLDPGGVDVLKSIGQSNQVRDYKEKTEERVLWNPNIFTGIPRYQRLSSPGINFDRLITWGNRSFLDWRVSWLMLGAIGMFLLLRILGFKWYFSIIGSLAFIFWPHMQGIIEAGHNAKVRAVCAMPLVIFGFINFVKKRDFISLLWFTLFFSLIFRTQHYQIIFYTLVVLLGIGIYYIVIWLKEKKYAQLGKTVALFLGAMIFSILMSAQPLFVAKEYTPYSTRGGNAINLNEKPAEEAKKSGGVTFDYATRWSFSPKELMTLISPRFYGGTSNEMYEGKSEPRLSGRKLPTYWGDMPFTQSSEYIGVIIVVLAVFGIYANRKNGLVITFAVLALFSLLLSFGKHFAPLYKLLFYYLPYFNKFRAPSMTLILFTFNVIVLAMFGLKSLLKIDSKEKLKPFLYISGFFVGLGVLFVIAPNLLSYSGASDARYNPQVLGMIKNIRKEMMQTDTLRMLAFLGGFIALVVLYALQKIKKELLVLGIFILVAVDSISVSYRFISTADFFNKKSAERRYFRKTEFDEIMLQDDDYYRVIELGEGFTSNDLAYRHQLISGYSAIKPQLIQDIFDNNLHKSNDPKLPINLDVISMMNGKYIIVPGQVEHPALQALSFNEQSKEVLYLNKEALPRTYFVEDVKALPDEKAVVRFMNSDDFEPDSIALVTDETLENKNYSAKGTVEITDYTPNAIELKASNDKQAFLVVAEAYFPIGWKCTVNGEETKIYQVNHVLRGIQLPAGKNEIQFTFEPKSYQRANAISVFTTYLVWILLIVLIVNRNKDKIRSVISRKK